MSASRRASASLTPARLVALLMLVFVVVAGSAMLRTSATFDEIVFLALGARGFHTGDFAIVTGHPRLPLYLYGLPVYLSGVRFPSEGYLAVDFDAIYHYARALLWSAGNNPERLLMLARAVGLAFGALTVLATYLLGRRHLGAGAALFAAALVAFLPDMLAHSGVAYNDVPLALGILASVYALDAAVRRPTPSRAALAALACALTVCVKFSGVIVGPILIALLGLEALSGRWRDAAWRRAIVIAVPVFLGVAYVTIALVYLGDWRVEQWAGNFFRESAFVAPDPWGSFLLGERYQGGRWYFFPVAFALKTPVALHVLILAAAVGAWGAARAAPRREWLTHGARAPAVGAALFLLALVTSSINVGFRHALPMLPLVCILVAQGVAPLWARGGTAIRATLALVFASFILSSVRHYPYFLSYLSEYVEGRPLHETLVGSSTDWGQGLVGLRDFMRERGVDAVALGYLGSALPEGYGIRYLRMPTYATAPAPVAPVSGTPRYLVVSASFLAGMYVNGDPYAALRGVTPIAVVGGSLYVFDYAAVAALPGPALTPVDKPKP